MTTRTISVLRGPRCGREDALTMPPDACLFFHPCAGCGAMLRPTPGDCCVFGSYGSVPCPPVQAGAACCADTPNAADEVERTALASRVPHSRT